MPSDRPNHFIALRPDQAGIASLAAISERLQSWELPGRWTHPDDLHLTLAFLGPVDDDEARYLPDALAEVAGSQRRPRLTLCGLGASGSHGEVPRAVFAALHDPEAACAAMHRDVCEALDLGPGEAFRPHITLCRPAPMPRGLPLFRDWPHLLEANGQAEWGACAMAEIGLWRSSGRGAVRYEQVATWPLHA